MSRLHPTRPMPDLVRALAALGTAVGPTLWAPVLAWTALVLLAEAILWRSRFAPSVGLWARGSLLAVLPALLILPPLVAPWVPSFAAPGALAPEATAQPLAMGAVVLSPEAASGAVPVADIALGAGVALAFLMVSWPSSSYAEASSGFAESDARSRKRTPQPSTRHAPFPAAWACAGPSASLPHRVSPARSRWAGAVP